MKEITLKLKGYKVDGMADVMPWGGGNACIAMDMFTVKSIKDIKNNLNDNGFGVESINGAVCAIYRDYGICDVYARTIFIGDVSQYTIDCYYEM